MHVPPEDAPSHKDGHAENGGDGAMPEALPASLLEAHKPGGPLSMQQGERPGDESALRQMLVLLREQARHYSSHYKRAKVLRAPWHCAATARFWVDGILRHESKKQAASPASAQPTSGPGKAARPGSRGWLTWALATRALGLTRSQSHRAADLAAIDGFRLLGAQRIRDFRARACKPGFTCAEPPVAQRLLHPILDQNVNLGLHS